MSLLDSTGDPEAERLIMSETERPGSWFGDEGADGRMLTQDETDMLVRAELWRHASRDLHVGRELSTAIDHADELHGILGVQRQLEMTVASHDGPNARGRRFVGRSQRGGIDSDPLVRLLAWRAWGDRDRRWFEERGVRKGERMSIVSVVKREVALPWPGDELRLDNGYSWVTAHSAWPGQHVEIVGDTVLSPEGWRPRDWRVSDRLREPPVEHVSTLEERCGFDRLWSERDPARRATMYFAERGGRRASYAVTDVFVREYRDNARDLIISQLDEQLTAMGAPRPGERLYFSEAERWAGLPRLRDRR